MFAVYKYKNCPRKLALRKLLHWFWTMFNSAEARFLFVYFSCPIILLKVGFILAHNQLFKINSTEPQLNNPKSLRTNAGAGSKFLLRAGCQKMNLIGCWVAHGLFLVPFQPLLSRSEHITCYWCQNSTNCVSF